jgi:hypothetical protein
MRLDLQCLTGSGSGANAKGVLSDSNRIQIAWTGATPTVAELYSKIQDAAQQVATQRFLPATHVAMHPRRWAWIAAQADSTGRPLIVPNSSAINSPATVNYDEAVGPIATLAGPRWWSTRTFRPTWARAQTRMWCSSTGPTTSGCSRTRRSRRGLTSRALRGRPTTSPSDCSSSTISATARSGIRNRRHRSAGRNWSHPRFGGGPGPDQRSALDVWLEANAFDQSLEAADDATTISEYLSHTHAGIESAFSCIEITGRLRDVDPEGVVSNSNLWRDWVRDLTIVAHEVAENRRAELGNSEMKACPGRSIVLSPGQGARRSLSLRSCRCASWWGRGARTPPSSRVPSYSSALPGKGGLGASPSRTGRWSSWKGPGNTTNIKTGKLSTVAMYVAHGRLLQGGYTVNRPPDSAAVRDLTPYLSPS